MDAQEAAKIYEDSNKDMPRDEFIRRAVRATDPQQMKLDMAVLLANKHKIDETQG